MATKTLKSLLSHIWRRGGQMKSEQTTSEAYNRANVFSSGLLLIQLLASSFLFLNKLKSSFINGNIRISSTFRSSTHSPLFLPSSNVCLTLYYYFLVESIE